jgi:UDP-N-acetylglucosamine 2-epimerase
VGYRREEIDRGIAQALDPAFHEQLRGMPNPYGDGHAARRVVERLKTVALEARLIQKQFVDVGQPSTPPQMEASAVAHVS